MDDKIRGEKWIKRQLSESEQGDECNSPRWNSFGWGIQKTKSAVSWIFGGAFRLRSGAESTAKTMQEPTGPEQLNGSKVQKPNEAGITDEGVKDGEKDDQKDILIDKLMPEAGETKKSMITDQECKRSEITQDFAGRLESRARADIHQFIEPQRLETVQARPKINDEFDDLLFHFSYFHGRFLRRSGDYLVRKSEEEGEEYILVSVAVLLEYKKDGTEDLDENFGNDEPVRIEDHVVRREKNGRVSIEHEHAFESLGDLLGFYILNPKKLSLNIKLKRGCYTRMFQFRERQIIRIKTLHSGNFGEVFLADVWSFGMIGQKAAVKALKKDSPKLREQSESFVEEARLMLTLSHEHIIETYGWMLDIQPFMIVMEYMEGGSLETYLLKSSEEPNIQQLLKFGLEAAEGLTYLHEMGIIHRNVSARNCLLTADHKLKLCNFDLAVAGPVYYMMKGEILPTRYLSPETLAIFLFLHASDTFAFGNLLYELFSNGQMPYENLTSAEARQKILEGEMNDLEETCAPPALRQFIQDNLWAYEMKTRGPPATGEHSLVTELLTIPGRPGSGCPGATATRSVAPRQQHCLRRKKMDDKIRGEKWIKRQLSESEQGDECNSPRWNSFGWGIQKTKSAVSWIFGGAFRLRSGAESTAKTMQEPTGPEQLNGSKVQKPNEAGITDEGVKDGEKG
ncbi:unnamed protein product [Caenorhabditis auriculariae]|uniref:Tyrosine-protein kinase n=1 Tax=Caenorhabditis auriculariae TaxID=2777116 RepID=A0A8S1H857_9PELO|nr:unnamed protein product [Caenorhabditis auriculariae]